MDERLDRRSRDGAAALAGTKGEGRQREVPRGAGPVGSDATGTIAADSCRSSVRRLVRRRPACRNRSSPSDAGLGEDRPAWCCAGSTWPFPPAVRWFDRRQRAGKTTLLRCLATLVRPTAGEVLWFGEPAIDRPQRRRLIGMVAHESRVYPQLTLRENLVFAARMCGVADPAGGDRLAGEMGLASHADLRPTQISRGMHQRMAVAGP